MRAVVLAVVLAGLSVPAPAHASCDSPAVMGFAPARGTLLPHPTIYVFAPRLRDPKLDLEVKSGSFGYDIRHTEELVADNPAYATYRVVLDATPDDSPVVMRFGQMARATYTIAAATPANHAELIGVTHISDYWTCSFNDAIELAVDSNASGYRIDWDDHTQTYLPPDVATLWRETSWTATAPPDRHATQIGHLNCLDYNVDPKKLDKSHAFELYALFSDGSSLRLGDAVAQLGDQGLRLPTELVGAAARRPPELGTITRVVAVEVLPWRAIELGALAGLATCLGGILLVRRRRRDHVPRAERPAR